MRPFICFAIFVISIAAQSCPDLYLPMEGKCIRPLVGSTSFVIESELATAREACARDKGHLPIIKSDEEDVQFKNIVNSIASMRPMIGVYSWDDYWLVLDLVCNATRRLEWADGTPVTYRGPNNKDFDYDCLNTHYTVMDRTNWHTNPWENIGNTDASPKVVLCVIDSYEATSPRPTERATTTPTIPLNCPSQYQAMEGKCIRPLYLDQMFDLDTDMQAARRECALDGGHLPIIKSDDENAIFNYIVENNFEEIRGGFNFVVLDLVCNELTRLLQWSDGTSVNYQGPTKYLDFATIDCVKTHDTVISRPVYNDWIQDGGKYYWTVLCVIDEYKLPSIDTSDDKCGDYELMPNSADSVKPCIQIYSEETSWELAQQRCAQDFAALVTINNEEENKYFWRSVVSLGFINQVHIGLHQSTLSRRYWVWIDGETDGNSYTNYVPHFPIPLQGECAAMILNTTAAEWINQDCLHPMNNLPFICRRIDYTKVPKDCPTFANSGLDIFPPGFPNSDIKCSYTFTVAANMLVEIEIVTLMAESNVDFLEIREGSDDGNVIANLTGSILSPIKFTTIKSNVMRVNWKPNGRGSGRGYRIRYNEVSAT